MKEEGIEKGSERNLVSVPMIGQGIVIIEMTDTTETVTETEIGSGKERETGVVTGTEHETVVVTEVVIMSVTENETVIESVIAIARAKGIGKGTTKLVTLIVTGANPVIGKLKGIMIMLSRKMIVGGMNNSLSTMIIAAIIPRVIKTVINIPIMIMSDIIRWRRMIITMTVQHLNHVKGIEVTVTIDDLRGLYPVSMITSLKVTCSEFERYLGTGSCWFCSPLKS